MGNSQLEMLTKPLGTFIELFFMTKDNLCSSFWADLGYAENVKDDILFKYLNLVYIFHRS